MVVIRSAITLEEIMYRIQTISMRNFYKQFAKASIDINFCKTNDNIDDVDIYGSYKDLNFRIHCEYSEYFNDLSKNFYYEDNKLEDEEYNMFRYFMQYHPNIMDLACACSDDIAI